jgi:alpha-beta hydrolase superfamily lysophospholipase
MLRARAYLHPTAPPGTPLVLLLHGYAAVAPIYEDNQARRLLRRGLHAARLELPFHLGRRPAGAGAGAGFFSSDPYRTAATLRQATEDAAAVVAWTRAEVGGPVGVLGFSLGGLVACLLAATVPLDSVVAVTPPCDMTELMLRRSPARIRRRLGLLDGRGGPWGDDLSSAGALLSTAMAPVTPHLLTPLTPAERITLVVADNDGIVGARAVRALAGAWGAQLLAYPHGHVTVMTARGITTRLHRQLDTDLRAAQR